MLRFDVLQNQWLILALFGGVILVLGLVLWYLAAWQASESAEECKGEAVERRRSRLPWILVLTYLGAAAFAAVYVYMRVRTPPNW